MEIHEIENEIARLKTKKSGFSESKRDIQTELAELNAKFVGRLNNGTFAALQKKRAELCRMLNDTESSMRKISDEIRKLSVEKENTKQARPSNKTTVQALVAVREEYQQFAADKTRVGSMRQMAAEFVLKLNPIIRELIGNR